MSISGGYEVDVFSKKSYYGSSQFFSSILNKGFPYYVIPPDVNITMSTHHLDYQENIFFTGQTSIQLGVYASASIADLANMLAKATLRAEMGPKVTCSVTIPDGIFESELPETIGETSTNTYSMLSKFGSYIPSVTLGGKFVLTSPIASGFSSGWVKDLGSWNIYEHKGSILPDVVYTKATYDLDSEILKAEASLGQYTPGSIYPGFALYKDNHLTTAAYMSTPYDSGALDSNALVLFRELKDGVYDVYPAFKTRGFNFLGTPMAKTVVGKPELKVSPEKLSFTPDGGTQTVTVTRKIYDKLDVIKQGIGYEEWWSYKKDKDDQYIITVKPTDEGRERDSYIEFEASVEGSNPLVKETVKVTFTQKGTTILTVAPQKLELLGYNSESFKYGEHTTSISATCRKEGEVVLVTSSDKNWLRVYEWEGEATTSGDYTTRKRKIAVSPNTSFVNPRTGTITVTAYYAHEYFEEQIEVLQKPMTPTMELSEETVTLLSSEKEGAAYSNSVHVFVESNLFDEALTRYVEKRGVTTSDPNWLEATVDNRTITIRAKTNTTESDRTGTVTYTVTMKNGETKSGIIKVKQLKNVVNVPFTTNPKEIRFSVKGGDKTVRIVGDNIKGITDIDCMSLSWLGGVASGTTVTLSAKESKLPEERIGTVYLTLEMNDGSIVKHYFLVYQDGTETVPEEAPAGFPTAEVLKSLINGGMPIYYGDTPPTVDGVFSQSPVTDVASTVVYDVDDDTEIGEDPPIRCVVKFSNQTAGNTIYWNAYSVFMEEDEEDPDAAYSSDINSSIMGSGDKFCVAAHLNSTYNNFYMELFGFPKGQYGYLCSGEVDGDVIRNLYVAFTSWTQPDFYTIDKDGDGVSYHTGWAPWVPEDDEEADVRGMTRQQGNTLPADLLKKLPIKHLLEKLLKAQKNRIQP